METASLNINQQLLKTVSYLDCIEIKLINCGHTVSMNQRQDCNLCCLIPRLVLYPLLHYILPTINASIDAIKISFRTKHLHVYCCFTHKLFHEYVSIRIPQLGGKLLVGILPYFICSLQCLAQNENGDAQ